LWRPEWRNSGVGILRKTFAYVLYGSRHCAKFRLALAPLRTPQWFGCFYGIVGVPYIAILVGDFMAMRKTNK
jgi:hypothetical protein